MPIETAHAPSVSVVISTRDKGDSVVATVRGILACEYPRFDVRIVDQSKDDRTEAALRPLCGDPRVVYLRSDTAGLSSGLNAGILGAQSEFVAITGDDCEIPRNWLAASATALQVDPRVGIVFGNVRDPDSRVARIKQDPRGYRILEDLNVRPAVTYLAKVVLPAGEG